MGLMANCRNRYKYHQLMIKAIFPWAEQSLEAADALSLLPLAASCPVASTFLENPLTLAPAPTQPLLPPSALLQLRGATLVLWDAEAEKALAFCLCQPALLFWTSEGSRAGSAEKEVGESEAQTFSMAWLVHSTLPQHRLAFVVRSEDRKALEQFGTELEKSAIIQKHFHQKFKPLRKLGKGATAAVYSAVRQRDSAVVAVKALSKSTHFAAGGGRGKAAFEQEVRTLSECRHDNLCGYEGVFETENTIYLVMPKYDRTLAALLQDPRPVPRHLILALLRPLLAALAHLHSRGLMHRDLKLDNIMLQKTAAGLRPVIIDMGMVQEFAAETYLFEQCGTPGYIAPEVFGPRPANPEKCDVFALGVIFHVLLFKKPVFIGNSQQEVYRSNRDAKLTLDPRLHEEDATIRDLLLRMLDLNNGSRISAEEALDHRAFGVASVTTPVMSCLDTEEEVPRLLPLGEI